MKYILAIIILTVCTIQPTYSQSQTDYAKDTDFDGISDSYEIDKYKTDPTKPDSDEDGVMDYQEILDNTNPADKSSSKLETQRTAEKPVAWIIGRISGVSALIAFTLVILMGLTMTSKILLKFRFASVPNVMENHQLTATYIAFSLTLIHVISFMFDNVLKLNLVEALVPFYVSRPFQSTLNIDLKLSIALGIISLYLALVLIITSKFRNKIVSAKTWRKIHYSSFIFYILFLTHGFLSGTDSNEPWMRGIYVGSLILVLSMILVRIFGKTFFAKSCCCSKTNSYNHVT